MATKLHALLQSLPIRARAWWLLVSVFLEGMSFGAAHFVLGCVFAVSTTVFILSVIADEKLD